VPALRKLHLDCMGNGAPQLEIPAGIDSFLAVEAHPLPISSHARIFVTQCFVAIESKRNTHSAL
jgi:hypothetical protein